MNVAAAMLPFDPVNPIHHMPGMPTLVFRELTEIGQTKLGKI